MARTDVTVLQSTTPGGCLSTTSQQGSVVSGSGSAKPQVSPDDVARAAHIAAGPVRADKAMDVAKRSGRNRIVAKPLRSLPNDEDSREEA